MALIRCGAWDGNRTRTPAIHEAADFKSAVSTYFTTQAVSADRPLIVKQKSLSTPRLERLSKTFRTFIDWRRGPESNRASRICNPVHNRFVTAPH